MGHEQHSTQQSTGLKTDKTTSVTPQLFYARRMSGRGIMLSLLALVALVWVALQEQQMKTGMVIGFVFFVVLLIVNIRMYLKPYVTIGADYIQIFKRRASFNQIVKYEDFDKGFVICFNAPPGMPKYEYDERLLVSYGMMKVEDKVKLEYALRQVILHALESKESNPKH